MVIIHGLLSNRLWFEEVADWVHAALGKGAYVRALEVGNGEVDSITRPMEWQLAELAKVIQADRRLRRGFNIIAHSQGTLLARAFVQRFDWPPVHVLISWVGPQAGQFGVPTYEPLLGYLNRVTSGMWYTPQLQSSRSSSRTLSFANYWRDPTKLDLYLANSGFLADINNERPLKNASYATRLARLEHFVLVYSSSDSIIQPAVSSWFGFYKDNSTDTLEPLASRQMYKEDWIGLRALDTTGRLHFAQIDCMHIEVPTASCKRDVWDSTTRAFLAPSVRALHAHRTHAACTPARNPTHTEATDRTSVCEPCQIPLHHALLVRVWCGVPPATAPNIATAHPCAFESRRISAQGGDGLGWIRENTPGFHFTSSSLPQAAYRYINVRPTEGASEGAASPAADGPETSAPHPAKGRAWLGSRVDAGARGRGGGGHGRSDGRRRPAPGTHTQSKSELQRLHADLEREVSDVHAAEEAAARHAASAEAARRAAERAYARRAEGTAAARARAAAAKAEAAMLEAEARAARAVAESMAKSEKFAQERLEAARARVDNIRRQVGEAHGRRATAGRTGIGKASTPGSMAQGQGQGASSKMSRKEQRPSPQGSDANPNVK